MPEKLLHSVYSLIGDFTSLYRDINSLSDLFPSPTYEKNMSADFVPVNAPSAGPVPVAPATAYHFNSATLSIRFYQGRIDFCATKNTESMTVALELLKKIVERVDKKVVRVALNHSIFLDDADGSIGNDLCRRLSLLKENFNPKEMFLSQNAGWKFKETECNEILTVQKMEITNKQTFEKFLGVAFSLDINTDALNREPLSTQDIKDIFDEMIKKDELEMAYLRERYLNVAKA